jgi:hypothetical protein
VSKMQGQVYDQIYNHVNLLPFRDSVTTPVHKLIDKHVRAQVLRQVKDQIIILTRQQVSNLIADQIKER